MIYALLERGHGYRLFHFIADNRDRNYVQSWINIKVNQRFSLWRMNLLSLRKDYGIIKMKISTRLLALLCLATALCESCADMYISIWPLTGNSNDKIPTGFTLESGSSWGFFLISSMGVFLDLWFTHSGYRSGCFGL